MPSIKPPVSSSGREAKQARVLDAAERLLRASDGAEFSMRDLAEAAGVSFATPFNYFGSKMAIMHALSARRIDAMAARFGASSRNADAVRNVLAAFTIGAEVLLEEPLVSRHVIGSLGSPTGQPGRIADHSRALWASALGEGAGIREALLPLALAHLPDQLAFGFRGCISFWVAGEISDAELPGRARAMAAALLLGFAEPRFEQALRAVLEAR